MFPRCCHILAQSVRWAGSHHVDPMVKLYGISGAMGQPRVPQGAVLARALGRYSEGTDRTSACHTHLPPLSPPLRSPLAGGALYVPYAAEMHLAAPLRFLAGRRAGAGTALAPTLFVRGPAPLPHGGPPYPLLSPLLFRPFILDPLPVREMLSGM